MKVTIDITSNELLHIKAHLLARNGLVKCGFSERTVADEVLRKVVEAAQDESSKINSES